MNSLFTHEVKYYFKSLKELTQLYALFLSILLVFLFALPAGAEKNPTYMAALIWAALTVIVAMGGQALFQRDHAQGQLAYYQLQTVPLWRIIVAKWMAYYLCITIMLVASFPVIAILVDIAVDVWPRYCIGLASGAMALSLITTMIAAIMAGQEKVGSLLTLVMLPLTIPITILGVHYLTQGNSLFSSSLFFLWGFSLISLPIMCVVGGSTIRASN